MFREFLDHKTQMAFAEENEVIEALVFDGPDKPFSVGIAVGAHCGVFYGGDTTFAKNGNKGVREQRVSIVISGDLFHPQAVGIDTNPSDLNGPGAQLDDWR